MERFFVLASKIEDILILQSAQNLFMSPYFPEIQHLVHCGHGPWTYIDDLSVCWLAVSDRL